MWSRSDRCASTWSSIAPRSALRGKLIQTPSEGNDHMSDQGADPYNASLLRQRALSTWDNEGVPGRWPAGRGDNGALLQRSGVWWCERPSVGEQPSDPGCPVPFKANADRRHRIPKQRFRVTNWRDYDASLRQRGSLTVWFTEEAITAWTAEPRTTPGRAACLLTLGHSDRTDAQGSVPAGFAANGGADRLGHMPARV